MTEHFTKKRLGKQEAPIEGMKAADRSTCVLWMNWYEARKTRHKHIVTRQISRETGLTQSSVVQIIHRDVGLKCFFRSFTKTFFALIVSFS